MTVMCLCCYPVILKQVSFEDDLNNTHKRRGK